MKTILAALMLTLPLSLPTHAAASGADCGPRQAMFDALSARFGEKAFASGVSLNNSVKFFVNPRTGTWSVLMVTPAGVACVLAVGDGLEVEREMLARNASF